MVYRLGMVWVSLSVLVGCGGTGALFTFQNLGYLNNTSSQAQLGNLGIRSKRGGEGFQRGAFLSDCVPEEVELSVDARIPRLEAALTGFGDKASAATVASSLGIEADAFRRMSGLLVSLDPIALTRSLKDTFDQSCKNYITLNGESSRLVTSAVLMVDLPVLQETTVKLQVRAVLTRRGSVVIRVDGLKKPVEARISPDSVLAYRYAHVCWLMPDGRDLLLRVDDDAYEPCPFGYDTSIPQGWGWPLVGTEPEPLTEESASRASR